MKNPILNITMLAGILISLNSCKKDGIVNAIVDPTPWKKSEYQSVKFQEYSSSNISSYTAVTKENGTLYLLLRDTILFHQNLTYSPAYADSTQIPDSMFELHYGVLVSEMYTDKIEDYFINGLYLYKNTLYIDYQRTAYSIDPKVEMYKSFLFILIEINSATSIKLIENGVEKQNYDL